MRWEVGEHLNWKDLAKYFIHGIAFSLFFLALAIAWVFVLMILVGLGFIIGLIIGLGLLFLIVGFLNSMITVNLWFDVKMSFLDLFFHGLALFVILLIVNGISVALPSLAFPGMATTVVTFVISTFLDGFVAKNVAGWWKQEYRKSRLEGKGFYPTIVCPSCKKKISEDYQQCPWCGTEQKSTRVQEKNLEKLRDVQLPKKKIECSECGREVFSDFNVCPYCGSELVAHWSFPP